MTRPFPKPNHEVMMHDGGVLRALRLELAEGDQVMAARRIVYSCTAGYGERI